MNGNRHTISQNIALQVRAQLAKAGCPAPGPVIVALSGGADSVALLAVLNMLGYDCRAAHCNFHLRGAESMRDMHFVQQLCDRLNVDLFVRDFDVAAHIAATGQSTEMACRELRYRWFDELLDRERAAFIAVGHHREDRAETFILNLMRGAGIEGLTSMRFRQGNVVRPLLAFTRAQLEQLLAEQGLGFVVDSTNAQNDFRRNSVRNRVFPLLADIFGPIAVDAVVRSVENLERTRALYRKYIDSVSGDYVCADGRIDIGALCAREDEPAMVLFELLRDRGFNYDQTVNMVERADVSGVQFRSVDGRVVAEISHGLLELTDAARIAAEDDRHIVALSSSIRQPATVMVDNLPVSEFNLREANAFNAYFDADVALAPHLWELRRYRRGDRMVPFGAKRSKLVSDLFANARYSPAQKRATWLLTCDGIIVWALGLKNSSFAAVGPETRRFLHLKYITDTYS